MDLDFLTGSVDAQTFTVGGSIFVLVELIKAAAPHLAGLVLRRPLDSSKEAEKRREQFVQILTLALGLIAGAIFLRESATPTAVETPTLTGLRRGFAAGAIAIGGWHFWRLTIRALWRRLRAGTRGVSKAVGRLEELDPNKPASRARSRRAAPGTHARKSGGENKAEP